MHDLLPIEKLRQLLDCNPAAGALVWRARSGTSRAIKVWNSKHAGTTAGSIENNGYRRLSLGCRHYLAHWLVFAFVMGRWPFDQLDHINNQRDDNRIANLREATNKLNSANRSRNKKHILPKGVHIRKHYRNKKYTAKIWVEGKQIYLGYFHTADEAAAAYQRAAAAAWGAFSKSN